MTKNIHEIRDPIHIFIRVDSDERKVIDSSPFQRLRYIHQLALSYLVYPGATHKRFEHSLGVMELADRVFRTITHSDAIRGHIRELIPEITDDVKLNYWRKVLRVAALCHDLGHLPFSHAAENELMPEGWSHERMTMELIGSNEMKSLWESMTPPLRTDDIIKLAVGPKHAKEMHFSDWESILSEIIVGDSFGVDRMDYLLRDAYHLGVAYGKFDHYRLIDTIRILTPPPSPPKRNGEIKKVSDESELNAKQESKEPVLGVEEGGLNSAEALLLARYFMYSQVYLHPVRRIYDIHLKDFLISWLPDGKFPITTDEHLRITDNEVISALRIAALDASNSGHIHAKTIINRKHFKVLYQRNPEDVNINPDAAKEIYKAAADKFGKDATKIDNYVSKGDIPDFPVLTRDSRIVSSLSLSQTLEHLPVIAIDYIFIKPQFREEASEWLEKNRNTLILPKKEVV